MQPLAPLNPAWRNCAICELPFLAEWGRGARGSGLWHTREICWLCEEKLQRPSGPPPEEEEEEDIFADDEECD